MNCLEGLFANFKGPPGHDKRDRHRPRAKVGRPRLLLEEAHGGDLRAAYAEHRSRSHNKHFLFRFYYYCFFLYFREKRLDFWLLKIQVFCVVMRFPMEASGLNYWGVLSLSQCLNYLHTLHPIIISSDEMIWKQ